MSSSLCTLFWVNSCLIFGKLLLVARRFHLFCLFPFHNNFFFYPLKNNHVINVEPWLCSFCILCIISSIMFILVFLVYKSDSLLYFYWTTGFNVPILLCSLLWSSAKCSMAYINYIAFISSASNGQHLVSLLFQKRCNSEQLNECHIRDLSSISQDFIPRGKIAVL